MHIALVHQWVGGPAGGGGGSRLMLDLALGLQDLGHEVVVVCHDYDSSQGHLGVGELDVRAVSQTPGGPVEGARQALRRFWLDTRPMAALVPDDVDIVNAHEWPALHAGRIASRRTGAPLVWHRNDHTIFERAVTPTLRHDASMGAARRALRVAGSFGDYLDARRAAEIVTIDRLSSEMARRAFRRSAVAVPAPPADHFFDPPPRVEARRRLGVPDAEFLVLGVGIMAPHRRFEDLVDAMARVADQGVRALILGSDHVDPGYAGAIADRIGAHDLADRVALPRASVAEAELRDAYAGADVFVFPNDHRQSWGLAPLEALGAGTPVILSRSAGVAEALEGRPGVRLVAPHAPSQIAAAIEQERANPDREGAQATGHWVRSELGSRRYAERIAGIFARVSTS